MATGHRSIGLVAASRRERGVICRASEQYDPSPAFRRARDYCERALDDWRILSTRHGALVPQQVIGPGERNLAQLSGAERAQWAERLGAELLAYQAQSAIPLRFVLLASQRYADLLIRAAPTLTIEQPLKGLGPHERLRWYDERLQVQSRFLRHL